MRKKLTTEQRLRVKELRKTLREERAYVPQGQGDGINQHLKLTHILDYIREVKQATGHAADFGMTENEFKRSELGKLSARQERI